MGLDVVLMGVTKNGSGPRRHRKVVLETVVDAAEQFAHLCAASGTPMLRRIDPFGSLVLTSAEMDQFIDEVGALREKGRSRAESSLLDEILRVALRCRDDRALEIHLEGD